MLPSLDCQSDSAAAKLHSAYHVPPSFLFSLSTAKKELDRYLFDVNYDIYLVDSSEPAAKRNVDSGGIEPPTFPKSQTNAKGRSYP